MPAPPNRRMSLWDRPGAAGKLAMSRAHAFGVDLGTDTGAVGALIPDFEAWIDPANLGSAYSGAGPLPVTKGGTGGITAAAARTGILKFPGVAMPDSVNIVTTGGTGNLVGAAGSGYPGAEALGITASSAGTFWLNYLIPDRIGGLMEWGRGQFTTSSRTLVRTMILVTGNLAGTLVRRTATTAPTAINVPIGAELYGYIPLDPYPVWSGGVDGFGVMNPLIGFSAANSNLTLAATTGHYTPFLWPGGNIKDLSFYVITAVAGTAMSVAIHESLATNRPGAMLWSQGGISSATAGTKTSTVGVTRPRELLYVAVYPSGAGVALLASGLSAGPQGSFGAQPLAYYTGPSGSFSDPASTSLTGTSGPAPILWMTQYN